MHTSLCLSSVSISLSTLDVCVQYSFVLEHLSQIDDTFGMDSEIMPTHRSADRLTDT